MVGVQLVTGEIGPGSVSDFVETSFPSFAYSVSQNALLTSVC